MRMLGVGMSVGSGWALTRSNNDRKRVALRHAAHGASLVVSLRGSETSLHMALDGARKQLRAAGCRINSTKVKRFVGGASRLISFSTEPSRSGSKRGGATAAVTGFHVIVTASKGMFHLEYRTPLGYESEAQLIGFLQVLESFKRSAQPPIPTDSPRSKTLHYGHALFDLAGHWIFERKSPTEVSLEGVGLAGRPECQIKFHRSLQPSLSTMSTRLRQEAKTRGEQVVNWRTDRIALTEAMTMTFQAPGSKTLIWLYRTARDRYELRCTGARSGTDWKGVDTLARSFKRSAVFASRPIGR
jgi:hypothetical protein